MSLIGAIGGLTYNPYVAPSTHDYSQDYFTIEMLEDDTYTLALSFELSDFTPVIEYSLDNGTTWTTASPTISQGDKVLIRCHIYGGSQAPESLQMTYTPVASGSGEGSGEPIIGYVGDEHFVLGMHPIFTGGETNNPHFNVYGNIMSLLYGDGFIEQTSFPNYTYDILTAFFSVGQYGEITGRYGLNVIDASNLILPATTLINGCYQYMFYGCSSLKTAPELPATTLATGCYQHMFHSCTSLTTAPGLPATTLSQSCYHSMFYGCTSLKTAPELPATTLADWCYYGMFSGCTSLTTAPELPATTLADWCYYGMFSGCTSLTSAPELPATTLADWCYESMFNGCTSLTTAPELPATTLAENCYMSMFQGCTSLTTAPELPVTTLADQCYNSMFENCTSLTTAPELPATTLTYYCYCNMFNNCTSLITAPELPATILTEGCYYHIFENCSSLNYIKCLATDISTRLCTNMWVNAVAALGTFVKASSTDWSSKTGSDGIPSGWTVQDAA